MLLLLLPVLAIGIEVYQLAAHTHCDVGGTVPKSHRSTLGFGVAILSDALSTAVACFCLYRSGGMWWLLVLPIVGHLFYGALFVCARGFYLRIHDYRLRTIYDDRSFLRAKRVATTFDASFHLLAAILIARQVPSLLALCATMAGGVAFFLVFSPNLGPLLRKLRPTFALRSQGRAV